MEKLLKTGVLAFVAALLAVSAPLGAAFAQSAGDQIKIRQAMMRENNSHVKAIRAFLKGPKQGLEGKKLKRAIAGLGTVGDVELRAMAVAGIASRLPTVFPKGTGTDDGAGKTRALPAIWVKRGEFEAAAAALGAAAASLQVAAVTGDKAKINAALGAMGKRCGACHKTFRAAKKKKSM